MADNKPIGMDVPGFDVLQNAVVELLNSYPGLNGREITFGGLTEGSGISVETDSGALVRSEITDIVGGVYRECQFPFYVVHRGDTSTERQRLLVTEFLTNLGAWICRDPVTIGGVEHRLSEYPALTGGRTIINISRSNNYALAPNSNGTQDWVLPVTVAYTHEFTKI